MPSLYAEKWKELEATKPLPRFIRNVRKIEFSELKRKVAESDPRFVDEITESLYSGDAIVVTKVFSQEFLLGLRDRIFEYGKSVTPIDAAKIVDGCANYHQAVDTTGMYTDGYTTINHSYCFFRWNQDPLGIYGSVDELWTMFKILSGLAPNEYRANIPSDGPVDRVEIIHYPPGGGKITIHSDPHKNQRMIIGTPLSRRGEDYETGGAHLLTSNKEIFHLEPELELGSTYAVYPSMFHGVEVIDSEKRRNTETIEGRWFMGLFSPDSHMVASRDTALKVE